MRNYARQIREAQVDFNRVRSLRREVIARMLSQPRSDCPFTALQQVRLIDRFLDRVERNTVTSIDLETIDPVIRPKPLEGDAKLAAVLVDSVGELTRLDRYERRALSRRKSAIRKLTPTARSTVLHNDTYSYSILADFGKTNPIRRSLPHASLRAPVPIDGCRT